MQALTSLDAKEQTIGALGIVTAVLGFSEIARINKIRSIIDSAINYCCDYRYSDLQKCTWHIVKIFGSGITLSPPNSGLYMQTNLDNLSSHYTLPHTVNALTGLIGTASAISMLIVISKRVFCNSKECEGCRCCTDNTSCYTLAEAGKNIGLFISFASLTINQFVNFIPLITQRSQTDILNEGCCEWSYTYPDNAKCLSAIENIYGSNLNISNYADLCGGNIWLAKENNSASITKASLMMAAIGIFALGWFVKSSFDKCNAATANNPATQNNNVQPCEQVDENVDLSDT